MRSLFLQGLFFKDPYDLPGNLKPLKPALVRLQEIAEKNHLSIEDLSLRYALTQSEIDGLVLGVDSAEQLDKNVQAMKQGPLSKETVEEIETIIVSDFELLNPSHWKLN